MKDVQREMDGEPVAVLRQFDDDLKVSSDKFPFDLTRNRVGQGCATFVPREFLGI